MAMPQLRSAHNRWVIPAAIVGSLMVLAIEVLPAQASGPPVNIVIRDLPVFSWRVVLEQLQGSPSRPVEGFDDLPLSIARFPDGTLLVANSRFEPALLRPGVGSLREVGRRGGGPGEYRSVLAVEVLGDTGFVFDAGQRRMMGFTSTGRYLISRPFAALPFNGLVRAGSRTFVSQAVRTPESAGLPLHEVDTVGNRIRSFGPEQVVGASGFNVKIRRRVASSSSEGQAFWAAVEVEPTIERYRLDGTMALRLTRVAKWFPVDESFHTGNPSQPPSTVVSDLREDRSGRLWVLYRVAGKAWGAGFGLRRAPNGVEFYAPDDFDAAYDSVLEVIDVAAGTLLVSARFDQYFFKILGEGLLARYLTEANGLGAIEQWRVSLVSQR